MKLIVDAGSTKTEWAIIGANTPPKASETPGVNALLADIDELRDSFSNALCGIDLSNLTEIYYYGAGCATEKVREKVASALPSANKVEVSGDLLGAARALFGSNRGLAGILGTGSNTGIYNGRDITANMPPLGFILGDEGSGASMGRELLKRVYRNGLLRKEFEQWLGGGYAEVLQKVYREPGANRFLASLTRFIGQYRTDCKEVIEETFVPFFSRIKEYYGTECKEAAFVGGLADAFAEEISNTAASHGITITKILKRPMQGLIEYHTKQS